MPQQGSVIVRKLSLVVLGASVTALVMSACGSDVVPSPSPPPARDASVIPERAAPGASAGTAPPSASEAGLMRQLHVAHTASRLADGRVLVAGGWDGYGAEIYDPETHAWSTTPPMGEARDGHTATVLSDGTVLIIGGAATDMRPGHQSGERYDPAADTWTPTAPMATPRVHHGATLLPDGRVLVTGGSTHVTGGRPMASAEVYDPVRDEWAAVPDMQDARMGHTATLLQTGVVLVAGGSADSRASELFDPSQDAWSETGETAAGVRDHAAELLADGRVLIVGGAVLLSTNSVTDNYLAELYDPTTGAWEAAGHSSGWPGAMAALPSGEVLLSDRGSVTIYDPATGSWTRAPSLSHAWGGYSVTTLPDGTVLMAGGWNGKDRVGSPFERYSPPE